MFVQSQLYMVSLHESILEICILVDPFNQSVKRMVVLVVHILLIVVSLYIMQQSTWQLIWHIHL